MQPLPLQQPSRSPRDPKTLRFGERILRGGALAGNWMSPEVSQGVQHAEGTLPPGWESGWPFTPQRADTAFPTSGSVERICQCRQSDSCLCGLHLQSGANDANAPIRFPSRLQVPEPDQQSRARAAGTGGPGGSSAPARTSRALETLAEGFWLRAVSTHPLLPFFFSGRKANG